MEVSDAGIPSLTATTEVTLTIQTTPPIRFNPDRLEVTLPEDQPRLEIITAMRANDPLNVRQLFVRLASGISSMIPFLRAV